MNRRVVTFLAKLEKALTVPNLVGHMGSSTFAHRL
jgi:hypothetical protein